MTRPRLPVGRYRGAMLLASIAVLACTESTVPAGPAQHLTLLSGDGQTGLATRPLPLPLAVRVSDDAGRPVPGVTVTWRSANPGAQFFPAADRTDADGVARSRWTVGVLSGPQSAEAIADGWDDRVAARAVATAGFKAVALMRGDPNYYMCAIDAEAQAWCWSTFYDTPPARVAAPGTFRFRQLAAAQSRSCGITVDDELWCWTAFDGRGAAPTLVRRGEGLEFRSVEGEWLMMCGITLANDGYCWGPRAFGDGQVPRSTDDPILIAGSHAWREIVVTGLGACGVTLSGQVLCWADNSDLALQYMGLEGEGPFLSPTPVTVVSDLSGLSGGDVEQCGLIAGGTSARCWGFSAPRNGSLPMSYDPQPYASLHKLTAAGRQFAALDSRGTVWAWGALFRCCHQSFDRPTRLGPEGVWADIENTGGQLFAIAASDSTVHQWATKSLGSSWKDDDDSYGRQRWPLPISVPGPP